MAYKNQKCCTTCINVSVNEMTDERYCAAKDFEPIRLRYAKKRPEWCPLLEKNKKHESEEEE